LNLGLQRSMRRIARKAARYKFDKRLRVLSKDSGTAELLQGRICDLSEGGLGAKVYGLILQGESVVLQFKGTDGNELVLDAMVRNSRGFVHGFEFVGLKPSQLAELYRLIRRIPYVLRDAPMFSEYERFSRRSTPRDASHIPCSI
jgi:hypothetical protein